MGMRCTEIQDVLHLKLCLDSDGCEYSDFFGCLTLCSKVEYSFIPWKINFVL